MYFARVREYPNPMDWGSGITYLGETTFKGKKVTFGVKDADRLQHVSLLGRSDAGRERLIVSALLQDAQRGLGSVLLDGSGRVSELLIERLPPDVRERLVYLDPSDAEYPFSWNPLDDYRALPEHSAPGLLADMLASVYRVPKGPLVEWAAREMLLRNDATLLLLYEAVAEPALREKLLPENRARSELEALVTSEPDTAEAVRQNGRYLAKDTLVRNLFGQTRSKFTFGTQREGSIFVVDLSRIRMFPTRISPVARLFAHTARAYGVSGAPSSVMIHECLRAFSQEDIELFFAEHSFAVLLSDSARLEQDWEMRGKALVRSGTILAFSPMGDDAEEAADLFFPYVTIEDIERMELEEAVVMLSIDAVRSRPFFAKPPALPPRENVSYQDVQVASRDRYATSRHTVDQGFMRRYTPSKNPQKSPEETGSFSNAFRSIFAKSAAPAAPAAPTPPGASKTPSSVPPKADANKKPSEIPEDELRAMLYVDSQQSF